MLTTYGPQQIAFISDACRSAQVVLGLASSVVDAYEGQAGVIQKDNFFSSRDGEESFAVPSRDGTPAYCIFSSILTKALSEPADFEALDGLYLKTGRMIVSSQSSRWLSRKESPPAALGAGKCQMPQCDPGFRPEINHYVDFGPALPNFQAQGEARQAAITSGREAAQSDRIDRSRSEWRRPYIESLQRLIGLVLAHKLNRHERGPLLLSSNAGAPHVEAPIVHYSSAKDLLENFALPGLRPRWNLLASVDTFGTEFADTGQSGVVVARAADLFVALPLHDRLWCTAIIDKGRGADGTAGGVELLAWGRSVAAATTKAHRRGSAEGSLGRNAQQRRYRDFRQRICAM